VMKFTSTSGITDQRIVSVRVRVKVNLTKTWAVRHL
jgi:hypothetical protein